MYLGGQWYTLTLPTPAAGTSHADALDVEVLQQRVLAPLLKIGDPRTDKRIDFVGGIRGPKELERLLDAGAAAVAFSMFPVGDRRPDGHCRRGRDYAAEVYVVRAETSRWT